MAKDRNKPFQNPAPELSDKPKQEEQDVTEAIGQEIADVCFNGMAHIQTCYVDVEKGKYHLHDLGKGHTKFTRKK